jgi:hypothetical protein
MTAEVVTSHAHVVIVHPAVVTEQGFGIIAACGSQAVAVRLAELWNRYGLADVPDTIEEAMQ